MSQAPAVGVSASEDPARIRLLVADHEIAREGLRAILETEPDLQVVAVGGPDTDLIRLVERVQPDIVLLDPRLPGLGGPGVCARLIERHPRLRVLIVSVYSEIDLTRAFIAAGAHGYVSKDIDRPGLIRAIRELHLGDISVSAAVADRVIEQMQALVRLRTSRMDWLGVNALYPVARHDAPLDTEPTSGWGLLTTREGDILVRLMNGERVSRIAADLYLSPSTVRSHLSSVFKKVGVHSQAELIDRLQLH